MNRNKYLRRFDSETSSDNQGTLVSTVRKRLEEDPENFNKVPVDTIKCSKKNQKILSKKSEKANPSTFIDQRSKLPKRNLQKDTTKSLELMNQRIKYNINILENFTSKINEGKIGCHLSKSNSEGTNYIYNKKKNNRNNKKPNCALDMDFDINEQNKTNSPGTPVKNIELDDYHKPVDTNDQSQLDGSRKKIKSNDYNIPLGLCSDITQKTNASQGSTTINEQRFTKSSMSNSNDSPKTNFTKNKVNWHLKSNTSKITPSNAYSGHRNSNNMPTKCCLPSEPNSAIREKNENKLAQSTFNPTNKDFPKRLNSINQSTILRNHLSPMNKYSNHYQTARVFHETFSKNNVPPTRTELNTSNCERVTAKNIFQKFEYHNMLGKFKLVKIDQSLFDHSISNSDLNKFLETFEKECLVVNINNISNSYSRMETILTVIFCVCILIIVSLLLMLTKPYGDSIIMYMTYFGIGFQASIFLTYCGNKCIAKQLMRKFNLMINSRYKIIKDYLDKVNVVYREKNLVEFDIDSNTTFLYMYKVTLVKRRGGGFNRKNPVTYKENYEISIDKYNVIDQSINANINKQTINANINKQNINANVPVYLIESINTIEENCDNESSKSSKKSEDCDDEIENRKNTTDDMVDKTSDKNIIYVPPNNLVLDTKTNFDSENLDYVDELYKAGGISEYFEDSDKKVEQKDEKQVFIPLFGSCNAGNIFSIFTKFDS